MRNKVITMLLSVVALAGLTSCEKTTEGLTGTTYYPIITILGETEVIYVGEEYTDPGCEAVMNGIDVTDQVVVSDNIDNTTPGIYHVTYTATNEQGFSSSASREVWVCKENSFANLYHSVYKGSTYCGVIVISDNGDGTYQIQDICGGYYFLYKYPGYPYDFEAEVNVTVAADGTLTPDGPAADWYWADDNFTLENGVYDSTTGEVSWDLHAAGDPFSSVKLTPVTK